MSFIFDLCVLAGVGCLAAAGYLWHPALAWCVVGIALVAFGVLGARARRQKKGSNQS